MKKRVVITGMGIVAPNGTGISDFQQSLIASKSGISKINELAESGFNCQVGGLCDFESNLIKKRFNRLNIPIISRSTLLLAQACTEAMENSGLLKNYDFESTHEYDVIIGSTIGAGDLWGNTIVPQVDKGKHLRLGSFAFEQIINSSPAAMISGIFGFTGRVISNSLACASSTEAIIEAAKSIISGGKKIVIAGGVEPYSKYYWATMDSMRITNPNHNNAPETASRPMSETARGFIPAEGSAVLILEEYEHATKRNAHIFAEYSGGFVNCGGQKNGGSMTAANKSSLIQCLSNAIADAGINSSQINYISGHLTGTKSDPLEIEAWVEALCLSSGKFPYINSTKSLIGHSIGACGAIETIASIIQMNHNFIHASVNCDDLHPEILKIIPAKKVARRYIHDIRINYLAKANFGFGDVNACIILKNFDE